LWVTNVELRIGHLHCDMKFFPKKQEGLGINDYNCYFAFYCHPAYSSPFSLLIRPEAYLLGC
jgi:hypothetical protein